MLWTPGFSDIFKKTFTSRVADVKVMDEMTMRDVKGILLQGSSGIDRCCAFNNLW